MNDKKTMREFVNMNLDWAEKNNIENVVLIGHLTALLCLVMAHTGFTPDQVSNALLKTSENYNHFLSDINVQQE